MERTCPSTLRSSDSTPRPSAAPRFQDFIHEPRAIGLRPRRAQGDPGRAGSDPGLPLQLPGGGLRLLRHGHQRRDRPRLPHPARSSPSASDVIVVEPLPNLTVLKDLLVDMEPVLDGLRAGRALAATPGRASRRRSHRVSEDRAQVHRPVRDLHPLRLLLGRLPGRRLATTATSARPRWPSSSASSPTPRDKRPWRVAQEGRRPRPGSGAATPSSTATSVCPKDVAADRRHRGRPAPARRRTARASRGRT